MTDQPTPETDAKLADDPQPSSDSPDYVRALEIHIHLLRAELALLGSACDRFRAVDNALRSDVTRLTAERDAAISLGRHALFCVHHTDAERIANTVGGNCPICNKAQIRQLRAELADERAKKSDALIAAVDDIPQLRAALELIAAPMRPDGTYNRDRAACGILARAALATSAQ